MKRINLGLPLHVRKILNTMEDEDAFVSVSLTNFLQGGTSCLICKDAQRIMAQRIDWTDVRKERFKVDDRIPLAVDALANQNNTTKDNLCSAILHVSTLEFLRSL